MQHELLNLGLGSLLLAFVPALAVIGILFRWTLRAGNAAYALLRMGVQLLLIGYLLLWLFEAEAVLPVVALLVVMVAASSWIALGAVREARQSLLGCALIAILGGGGLTLLWVTQGVLSLEPWSTPRILIPLAGMSFSTAMNSVSLAAERYHAERQRGAAARAARDTALQAALIPTINSLFAVGLVALPGMMTGQILAGISPLVATRYQIMVMCMLFGAAGLSAASFLVLAERRWPGGDSATAGVIE